MDAICGSCRFWCPPPPGQNANGQCRRYPPKPFMVLAAAQGSVSRLAPAGAPQTQQVVPQFPSAWPPAPADGWCGEHEPVRDIPNVDPPG